jgi:hypothetical protein
MDRFAEGSMIQLTAAMVGMLGGPALQVLMVLAVEREPRALSFICDMANLSDKTASAAVRKLKTLGWITENGRFIYQIASAGYQLPLGAEVIESGEAVESPVKAQGNLQSGRKISDIEDHDVCMYESDSINNLEDDPTYMVEVGNSGPESTGNLAETLEEAGFTEPGLSRLRAMPGLTGRVVRYHAGSAPSLGALRRRAIRRVRQDLTYQNSPPGPGARMVDSAGR